MEVLNKKSLTAGVLGGGLLLLGFIFWAGFSSGFQQVQSEIAIQREKLAHDQLLLARRKTYEEEWKAKEALFSKNTRPEETLNFWVKAILDYAQAQKIVFEKIEPAGIQEKDGRKTMRLLLQFQGDIGKLLRLLHYLYAAEPLTQIKSLVLKADETEKVMRYEVVLGKVL